MGDEFALAQVVDHVLRVAAHPEGHPAAGAATIEAEHEAGMVRRAPVDPGADAERAAKAVQGARQLSSTSKPGFHISEP